MHKKKSNLTQITEDLLQKKFAQMSRNEPNLTLESIWTQSYEAQFQ